MKTIIMLVVLLALFGAKVSARPTPPPLLYIDPVFIKAIEMKEQDSKKKEWSIGDTNKAQWAYGNLQIRQCVVDDVNYYYGTHYKSLDCLGNKELSEWMLVRYLSIHCRAKRLGREPTLEDFARTWNGGPSWHKKPAVVILTTKYWDDVQRFMLKISSGKCKITSIPKIVKPIATKTEKVYNLIPVKVDNQVPAKSYKLTPVSPQVTKRK